MFAPSLFVASLLRLSAGQTYSATYLPSNAPNQTEQGQTGTNQCGASVNQSSGCQNVYSMPHLLHSISAVTTHLPQSTASMTGVSGVLPSLDQTRRSELLRCGSRPARGPQLTYFESQRIEVAWCIKVCSFSLCVFTHLIRLLEQQQSGYGTRLIPDGTITGAHFVITPDFVQVTGTFKWGMDLQTYKCAFITEGVGNLTNLNIPAGDVGVSTYYLNLPLILSDTHT